MGAFSPSRGVHAQLSHSSTQVKQTATGPTAPRAHPAFAPRPVASQISVFPGGGRGGSRPGEAEAEDGVTEAWVEWG